MARELQNNKQIFTEGENPIQCNVAEGQSKKTHENVNKLSSARHMVNFQLFTLTTSCPRWTERAIQNKTKRRYPCSEESLCCGLLNHRKFGKRQQYSTVYTKKPCNHNMSDNRHWSRDSSFANIGYAKLFSLHQHVWQSSIHSKMDSKSKWKTASTLPVLLMLDVYLILLAMRNWIKIHRSTESAHCYRHSAVLLMKRPHYLSCWPEQDFQETNRPILRLKITISL